MPNPEHPFVCAAQEVPRDHLSDPPAQLLRVVELWAFDRRKTERTLINEYVWCAHVATCFEWSKDIDMDRKEDAALVDDTEQAASGEDDNHFDKKDVDNWPIVDTSESDEDEDGSGDGNEGEDARKDAFHRVVEGWREAVHTGAMDHNTREGVVDRETCQHVPDGKTVRAAEEMPSILDVTCSRCGASGSFPLPSREAIEW